MKKLILSYLLHFANRNIIFTRKEEFYKIKTQLLQRYGSLLGEEIQHVKKICYSCEGSGKFKCEWKPTEPCWSCGGDGIYEEFWVRLNRYQFGRFVFHQPTVRMTSYEPLFEGVSLPVIEGYIRHDRPKYHIGAECCYWLFLFYDRSTFRRVFGRIGYPSKKRTPLVFLATLLFDWRMERWKVFKPKIKWKPNWRKRDRLTPLDPFCDFDTDLPF